MFIFLLLFSFTAFANDYSLYVNEKGRFDLEASFEFTPQGSFTTVKDITEKGFLNENVILALNTTHDFEIREQKLTPIPGGFSLASKSCKKKIFWFCRSIEFKCDVSFSDSSYKQVCKLNPETGDAPFLFDTEFDTMNTLDCQLQGGRFRCAISSKGRPKDGFLADARRLAIAGATESLRGFYLMQEYFEGTVLEKINPTKAATNWSPFFEEGKSCSKRYQVFKILGKMQSLKRTCLEIRKK